MKHVLKTAPATEPVTLAEMRLHLGISQSTDTARDSIVTGRIISARQWAEDYTRRPFITQTFTAYASDFPGIVSLKAPLVSVTHVKYLDSAGTLQTLDPSKYLVDLVESCVVPAYGLSWPDYRQQKNSIQVEYVCGYGNAAAVPEPIKDAIRFTVGQWEVFQNSIEGVMRPFTIPNAAKQLLDNYIDMREYF